MLTKNQLYEEGMLNMLNYKHREVLQAYLYCVFSVSKAFVDHLVQ